MYQCGGVVQTRHEAGCARRTYMTASDFGFTADGKALIDIITLAFFLPCLHACTVLYAVMH